MQNYHFGEHYLEYYENYVISSAIIHYIDVSAGAVVQR